MLTTCDLRGRTRSDPRMFVCALGGFCSIYMLELLFPISGSSPPVRGLLSAPLSALLYTCHETRGAMADRFGERESIATWPSALIGSPPSTEPLDEERLSS